MCLADFQSRSCLCGSVAVDAGGDAGYGVWNEE